MAKNYTTKEVYRVLKAGLKNGKITEEYIEVTKRYPVLSQTLSRLIVTSDEDSLNALVESLPDYMTALKYNKLVSANLLGDNEESEKDEAEEVVDSVSDEEIEAMKDEAIKDVIKEDKKEKKTRGRKKKEEKEEVTETTNEIENMSAKELFNLCKEKGLKVKPKQKAEYYMAELNKLNESDDDDWDDDWDDEESEVKPKKEDKKEKNKASSKKVEEEDEDDDWDI